MNKGSIKFKTIYQDQRVAEEFCNFRCEYCEGFCPSGYSLSKDINGNLKVSEEWYDKVNKLPLQAKKYFEDGRKLENFYNIVLEVMNKTKNVLYADILKISGGEVTTNKYLFEFIKKIHNKYPSIQILTNGFNITENEIKEYKRLGNISFQVSIDGATPESNYAKSHSAQITEKVLKNIENMIKENIGVEINCVLTKYNTDKILELLERFKNASNFIIVPRPVRGEPKEKLNFTQKQVLVFEKNIKENYDKYSKILPPKAYINRLIEIMKQDQRSTTCYIPFFVQSIDGYGNFEECPIGLITEVSNNIFNFQNEKDMHIENRVFEEKGLCKNCTNQYEMLNLYVEGEITKEDLKKMPSLNSNEIIEHIDNIKEYLIKYELKRILKEKYSIEIEKIEKNEESTDGNVYMIYCKDKKYVIKIYNSIKHTESMIKLHNKLTKLKLNIPYVIFDKQKKGYEKILNKNYCVVYSFLNGEQIGWDNKTGKLDDEVISLMAKGLKEFHKNTKNNDFNLPKVPFENNNGKNQSALHFDLTRNNIFKCDGQIGFIDFDDAKYGDPLCDIAILIANLFFSKTRGVDLQGMSKFLNEYYCNEKTLKDEKMPFIKEYALSWIDYILAGNEFDTSTTESFEVRYKLIKENL